MSGAVRDLDQADFDLDRFIDMFDEAMTSSDPRVVETLRKLMMIVVLTRPEIPAQGHDRRSGPLRRALEDINHLHRRIEQLEDDIRGDRLAEQQKNAVWPSQDKYTIAAAQTMASQIDADVLKNLSRKINVDYTLGPEQSVKGLK